MGKPSSQDVAHWVELNIENDDWRVFSEVSLSAIRRALPGVPELTISDWIDELEEMVLEVMRNRAARAVEDGALLTFELDGDSPTYIRRINNSLAAIVSELRSMDDFAFEDLCASILRALGGDATVTPRTGDGGVDFIAYGLKKFAVGLPVPNAAALAVVGQAKRYKDTNRISETEVRKFVGGAIDVQEIHRRANRIRTLGPLLLAFWTTSSFHESARDYCARMGIWHMDGMAIAGYMKHLGISIPSSNQTPNAK